MVIFNSYVTNYQRVNTLVLLGPLKKKLVFAKFRPDWWMIPPREIHGFGSLRCLKKAEGLYKFGASKIRQN